MIDSSELAWRRAHRVLLAAALALMAAVVHDYGYTWDDQYLIVFGESLPGYYKNFPKPFDGVLTMHLYGGLFELLALAFKKLLWFTTPMVSRHVLNMLFGWGTLAFASLLARRLFGARAAAMVVALLLLSPRFFAHCMNNAKDIPFAFAYTMSLYSFSFIKEEFPYFRPRHAVMLVLGAALCISFRAGGLIVLGYGAALLRYYYQRDAPHSPRRYAQLLAWYAGGVVCALVLGSLAWPWALENPLVRPFEALVVMSRFVAAPEHILYSGQWLAGTDVPREYIVRWLGMTTPPAVLAAGLATPALALAVPAWRRRVAGLWLAVAFPLGYVVALGAILYDGMRHLLFVYPAFVVLAAAGLSWALRRRGWRIAVAVALVLASYDPARFSVVNHPNQVAYFNQFVGGAPGAFMRYEMDYWANSFKQQVDWIRSRLPAESGPVRIASGDPSDVAARYMFELRDPRLRVGHGQECEWRLELLRDSPRQMAALLASDRVEHVVAADGAPLSVALRCEHSNAPPDAGAAGGGR